jgi:hypothetical protein
MIDFGTIFMEKVVIHKVGNKTRNESYQLSKEEDNVDDENLKIILEKYFLKLFTDKDSYHFYHESDINLNEVYHFSKKIFAKPETFYDQSVNIVKHLYNKSSHPNIKSGDFYMGYFSDELESMKIIGIFKAENKDTFLKIDTVGDRFSFSYDKGLNLNKVDKGCLIIENGDENNYTVYIIDSIAKTNRDIAKYWEEEFLNVKRIQDDISQTREIINIVEEFSNEIFKKELGKDPKEIHDFKTKSHNYINNTDDFNVNSYIENTITNENEKKIYLEFKREYEVNNRLNPINNFEINHDITMKNKKRTKSKIILDTGIDLILSNYDYVDEGYDEEKHMNYMKIYYNSKK